MTSYIRFQLLTVGGGRQYESLALDAYKILAISPEIISVNSSCLGICYSQVINQHAFFVIFQLPEVAVRKTKFIHVPNAPSACFAAKP